MFYFLLCKMKKQNRHRHDFHDMISELHLRMFMFICCSPFRLNKGSVRLSVGVKSNVENPRHLLIDI